MSRDAWLRTQLPPGSGMAATAGKPLPPPPVIASAIVDSTAPPDPLPDPILAPFLSDFRPGVWAAKHVDLILLMLLALLEALLQRPATPPLIAAKAVLTCSGMVVPRKWLCPAGLLWPPYGLPVLICCGSLQVYACDPAPASLSRYSLTTHRSRIMPHPVQCTVV